jgi:uncharacterized protein (DUF1697 family)
MTGLSQRFVVLLRGINVGGRHCVSMAELRLLFAEELGCTRVETYIQSGNVVCATGSALSEGVIAEALGRRFGFAVPVVLRRAAAFVAAVAANPFAGGNAEVGALHVVFLQEPHAGAVLQTLAAKCVGDERMVTCGRELFVWLPHGVGRSKLALALTAPSMPGSSTMRNWKTVLQLEAMLLGA